MRKWLTLGFTIIFFLSNAQKITLETLLEDKISIRALEIEGSKVWYVGTDSKFGFVDYINPKDFKQIKLSEKSLQFRTLSQNKNSLFTINIESPAHIFEIDKRTLDSKIVYTDTVKTAFYDALHFRNNQFYTFSDPQINLELRFLKFSTKKKAFHFKYFNDVKMNEGEAAFAASNTNIASTKNNLWIATGGRVSRIIKMNLKTEKFEVYNTPFVQGESSQGIYSIDFLNDSYGIAVGGDYTQQEANVNNIATTADGGKTWMVQASGINSGYSTWVKFRPNTNGKEVIALGDQHISYSNDFGKTWKKISDEKGFYTAQWISDHQLVLAGKNKIVKATLKWD